MPNGRGYSDQEWDKIEGPLRVLDEVLKQYAHTHQMEFEANYHGIPMRRIMRREGNLFKAIDVFVKDYKKPTYSIVASVWEDRVKDRYFKDEFLPVELFPPLSPAEVVSFIEKMALIASVWTSAHLKPSGVRN